MSFVEKEDTTKDEIQSRDKIIEDIKEQKEKPPKKKKGDSSVDDEGNSIHDPSIYFTIGTEYYLAGENNKKTEVMCIEPVAYKTTFFQTNLTYIVPFWFIEKYKRHFELFLLEEEHEFCTENEYRFMVLLKSKSISNPVTDAILLKGQNNITKNDVQVFLKEFEVEA